MDLKLGQILSRILKERKITLRQISAATGVPTSTLGEWTNNRQPRNLINIKKVALFLGVSLNFLLFGEFDEFEKQTQRSELHHNLLSGTYEITLRKIKLMNSDGMAED